MWQFRSWKFIYKKIIFPTNFENLGTIEKILILRNSKYSHVNFSSKKLGTLYIGNKISQKAYFCHKLSKKKLSKIWETLEKHLIFFSIDFFQFWKCLKFKVINTRMKKYCKFETLYKWSPSKFGYSYVFLGNPL